MADEWFDKKTKMIKLHFLEISTNYTGSREDNSDVGQG